MLRSLGVALVSAAAIWSGGCGKELPTAPAASQVSTTGGSGQPVEPQGCARTSVGLVPLVDLGPGTYQGHAGGLYPGGTNARSAGHEAAGLALARQILPLDSTGVPDGAGRYALVSIGMSNTTQEFSTFKQLADSDPQKDPRLAIVDGAQGGQTGTDWANPGCQCWSVLDQRLRSAGVSAHQVAIVWIKLAESRPSQGFPLAAQILQANIVAVVHLLKQRFPNLQLAYLSSRIYAGYATTTLNPEPYAYESAFAVRWAIEQLMNTANAPWVAWGPYFWADGLQSRSDGVTWSCGDLNDDGTHPSTAGRQKVAEMLQRFFKSDTTAREWFLTGP